VIVAERGPQPVSADEYARRVRALLGPGGLRHALPRRRRDLWILLHAIARRFGEAERLSEVEADARIADFLRGPGRALELDRVTLRRALVDEGFLDRDPAGRDYRRSRRHERRVVFEDSPDPEAALSAARRPATG
jgi:hypothetical protein